MPPADRSSHSVGVDEQSLTGVDIEALIERARLPGENRASAWLKRTIKHLSLRAGLNPAVDWWLRAQRAARLPRLPLATVEGPPGGPSALVLFYHKVQRRPFGLWGEPVLNAEAFEEQLAYLARHYHPIPLSQLVAAIEGEGTLPERAVAITFDDGYRNNLILAAPLLRRHRIPATIFVASGLVGSRRWMWAYQLEEMFVRHRPEDVGAASGVRAIRELCTRIPSRRASLMATVDYLKRLPERARAAIMERLEAELPVDLDDENRFLSWEELKELPGYGFEVGSHTVHHPILTRLPLDEVEREVEGGIAAIAEHLGTRPTLFAYPNGDTTPEVTAIVERHCRAAFTTQPAACSLRTSRWELPRLAAPDALTELAFDLTRSLWSSGPGPTPGAPLRLPPPAGR